MTICFHRRTETWAQNKQKTSSMSIVVICCVIQFADFPAKLHGNWCAFALFCQSSAKQKSNDNHNRGRGETQDEIETNFEIENYRRVIYGCTKTKSREKKKKKERIDEVHVSADVDRQVVKWNCLQSIWKYKLHANRLCHFICPPDETDYELLINWNRRQKSREILINKYY